MKQLLHCCGNHIIVGLHDTVYYGSGNVFCELLAPAPPPSQPKPLSSTAGMVAPDVDDDDDEVDDKTKELVSEKSDLLEVTAVAVTTTTVGKDFVWCAVTRSDKSLALYKIFSDNNKNPNIIAAVALPHTVHKTAKRVSTMSFATVPGPNQNRNNGICQAEGNYGTNVGVIVVGDLAGDATAFALEISKDSNKEDGGDATATKSNTSEMEADECTTKNRRLLLGHTASMLTSVHVVETKHFETEDNAPQLPQEQRILSADRDEKIRVSSFPATHCIQGYLLGHQAFVSSVAVSSRTGRCVSLGGDNTLRLWNFVTCQELAVALTMELPSNTAKDEDEDGNDKVIEAGQRTSQPVPSQVAINADGEVVVAICDDSTQLHLWKVHPVAAVQSTRNGSVPIDELCDNKVVELCRCCGFKCAAQPLAVSFLGKDSLLVILREPQYVEAFSVAKDAQGCVSIHAVDDNTFCVRLRQAATMKAIVIPDRLLEKDEWGNLKMQKMNEKRSGATIKPWNNAVRRETAKERTKRLRKRRRDQYELDKNNRKVDFNAS